MAEVHVLLTPQEALRVSLRELRLRRRSLRRRGLSEDPRWIVRMAEIGAAIGLLDAMLRVAQAATSEPTLTVAEALARVIADAAS